MNMKLSYFKLPNILLDYSFNASCLKVASYLYSQMYHRKSAKVRVRQITIAKRCSLSVATVKRCISTLEVKGFIIHKSRSVKRNGYLGTYTYTMLPVGKSYFSVPRKAFSLEGKLFSMYLLMSKLRVSENNSDTPENTFFHSLTDLSEMTGYKRSEVSSLIKKLCKCKMIVKNRRRTHYGDFTENHFFVGLLPKSYTHIIYHSVRFVKCFIKNIIKKAQKLQLTARKLTKKRERTKLSFVFSYLRGGGRNELSIVYYPLRISFRRRTLRFYLNIFIYYIRACAPVRNKCACVRVRIYRAKPPDLRAFLLRRAKKTMRGDFYGYFSIC